MRFNHLLSVLALAVSFAVAVPVKAPSTRETNIAATTPQPGEVELPINGTDMATSDFDPAMLIDYMTCPQFNYQPTNAHEGCVAARMKNYGCESVNLPRHIKSVMLPWPGVVCWLYQNLYCSDFDGVGQFKAVYKVHGEGEPHLPDADNDVRWANHVGSIKCNHV